MGKPRRKRSTPYARFRGSNPTLRDYLALDRTVLSNERTLLAYVRTALTIIVVGFSAFKFLQAKWIRTIGLILIGVGLATAAIGVWRYFRTRERILTATEAQPPAGKDAPPLEP